MMVKDKIDCANKLRKMVQRRKILARALMKDAEEALL